MVSYSTQNISSYTPSNIQDVQQGKESVVVNFLRSCDPIIDHFSRKFAAPKSFDYDDLMQIGRLTALKAAKQFETGKGKFGGYVTTSIANAIHTVERRKRLEHSIFTYESDLDPEQNRLDSLASIDHNGFEQVDRKDAMPLLRSRLSEWRKTLSPKKNRVIDLIFGQESNQSQAASKMGLSRQRISRMLKGILENGKLYLADLEALN